MKKLLSGIAVWICVLGLAPAATFTVTNLNDSGTGSLRAALLAANGSAGADEITFTGLAGTITLASALPAITDEVAISGTGASLLTVSGGNAVRIIPIDAGRTVQMSGITLANGKATNYANGAAIENHGTLTVNACVFSNNQINGGFGGAIFNDGDLTLTNTTFLGNIVTGENGFAGAGYPTGGRGGAGAGVGGAIFSAAGSLAIANCTFTGNRARGGGSSGTSSGGSSGDGGRGGGPTGGAGGIEPPTGSNGAPGGAGGFGSGGGGGSSMPDGGAYGGAGGAGGFGAGGGGGGAGVTNQGQGSLDGAAGAGGFGGGKGGHGSGAANGGGGGAGFGSAIFIAGGDCSIIQSTFHQNEARGGSGGTATSMIRTATGATGGAGMGALFIYAGSSVVEECTFSANVALGGSGGSERGLGGTAQGAAILNFGGDLQISRSTIVSCQATGGHAGGPNSRHGGPGGPAIGGGIACVGGSTMMTNVSLSQNIALGGDANGGALGGGSAGAANGGGLAVTGGSVSTTNCTFTANWVQPGSLFPNTTFGGTGNSSPGLASGGGIYTSGASPSLKNILFSGNLKRVVIYNQSRAIVSTTDTASDGSGSVSSHGHNLFTTDTGVTGIVASDLRNIAASLGTLRHNGGPTQTHALPAGSPAINAGDNVGAPATDQRGLARPQGETVDIGSYELAALTILIDGVEVPSGSLIRNANVTVSFQSAFSTGAILYTLDGSTPTFSSTLYTDPFTLTNSATIRVVAYSSDFTSSVFAGPLNFIRAIPRTLTVTTSGPGTVAVDPPNTGPYPDATVVTLTAVPAPGYMFQGWSGALLGNTSPATLTMSGDRAVQATFVAIANYTLSVTTNGQGTVTLSPPGGTYQANTVVTLSATPAAGWLFQGWTGDLSDGASSATLAMTSNRSVTANFVAIPTYTLSVTQIGQGMVTLDPPGGTYLTGTLVTLTEEPASGWIFSGWGGDANGSASQVQITMNANKNVQATFTALFSLTLTTLGGGAIGVTPQTGPYIEGTIASVVATPASGWQFVSWLGDLENSNAVNDITMSRNKSIEAVFGTPLQTNVIGSGAVNRQPDLPLYPMQSSVRLSAIPAAGSYFSFWSNPINSTANSVDFSIVNPMPSVFAVFALLAENESAFNVLTDGGGTVAASPTGAHFTNGTTVQLLAKPATGQAFLGWSGDASGGNPTINVVVDSSKTVTAHFTKRPAVAIAADGELFRSEGARLVIRGEAGSNYQIVAAQTLTGQFIVIGDVTNVFGIVQFLDPNAASLDQRFYRVLVAP